LQKIIASKQVIEQIFSNAARAYDRVGPNIFTQFGERLVKEMPLLPGARVLDIATGTGAVLFPLARRVGPEGNIVGIDLSSAMLLEAKRAADEKCLANIELCKMDAERLEFPNQSFDAVTCAFALFFFPNMYAALSEMYRVCKPGGCIAITLFNKTPAPFDPGWPILLEQFMTYSIGVKMPQQVAYTTQEVETLLSRSGFHSIQMQTEINEIIFANLEDWWAFQLTSGSSATIMGMDKKLRAQFKDEYLAKLRSRVHQDGLHLSLSVIYALAKR